MKYVGDTAARYDGHRERDSKWRAEDEAAEAMLRVVDRGARTLDIPVGTGRLLPYLQARGFAAHGLDISPDMLAIARGRADELGFAVNLGIGDIRNIPFGDDHFELVTCLRFLNWIDGHATEAAVTELARVTSDKLLLGIRYLPPLDELKECDRPALSLGMRVLGLTRLRARRHGLHVQPKDFIATLFDRVGLDIIEARHIERRFDGTDYVFFLLQKR